MWEFSAGGIIYHQNPSGDSAKKNSSVEFLLILPSYGQWTFPKGQIEKKEKSAETALRECHEETGLKNLKIGPKLAKHEYFYRRGKTLIHKLVTFYLVEAAQKTPIVWQKEEIEAAQWFNPQEAQAKLYFKEDKQSFQKALKILGMRDEE